MAAELDGTSKGLLGTFAVLTLGSGIASLVYGVFLLLRYLAIDHNYGIFNLFIISIVLIVVGGLLIITVILGVLGALKDAGTFRLITVVLLFLLFVVLAVVGVWAMVSFKTGSLQRSIDLDIDMLTKTDNNLTLALKKKAQYLSQTYKCCGSNPASSDTSANNQQKPDSCCVMPGCGINPLLNERKYFEDGCSSIYFATKSKAVYQLAILTLAAAGATLIGLIAYGLVFQRARAGYAVVSRG